MNLTRSGPNGDGWCVAGRTEWHEQVGNITLGLAGALHKHPYNYVEPLHNLSKTQLGGHLLPRHAHMQRAKFHI